MKLEKLTNRMIQDDETEDENEVTENDQTVREEREEEMMIELE